jgi:hypothetical protein
VFGALTLLEEMRKSGVRPNMKTFTAAMEVRPNTELSLALLVLYCTAFILKYTIMIVRILHVMTCRVVYCTAYHVSCCTVAESVADSKYTVLSV